MDKCIVKSKQQQDFIMDNFKTGSKLGFDLMYQAFFIHLYYFAVSVIKDHDDAKDIVVTAIMHAFSKYKDFISFNKVQAYLYITVKHKCLKYLDYNKKLKKELSIFDPSALTEESVDAKIVRSEFLQLVYMEIESLPPIRKQVFKLFYIDGLTITQIAKKMNMTQVAASNNKLKALNQLKQLLSIKKIIS